MLNKKGQNAIEYILIFAAVTVVLMVILSQNGMMSRALNEAMDTTLGGMERMLTNTANIIN